MKLYIYNEKNKLIGNQLGSSYRYLGINSDGSAWFLICTSLISQQLPTLRLHACHIEQSVSLGTVSFGGVTRAENVRSWGVDCFGRGVLIALGGGLAHWPPRHPPSPPGPPPAHVVQRCCPPNRRQR